MSQARIDQVARILGISTATIAAAAGAERLIRVTPVQSELATRVDIVTSHNNISPTALDKSTFAALATKPEGVYAHQNKKLTKVGARTGASSKGASTGKLVWNTASFIVVDGDALKAQKAKNKRASAKK